MLSRESPEAIVETAVSAVRAGSAVEATLDELAVPVYLVDPDGLVTYWNKACVEFAGREPEFGRDRWCVSWKLYTTEGEPLPHDRCPMAEAIHRRQAIRNEVAIAERPDGSRAAFLPYPTPLFDDSGRLTGGVNLLIDVSEEQAGALDEQASRCRRLAAATHDRTAADVLKSMAENYDRTADALRNH